MIFHYSFTYKHQFQFPENQPIAVIVNFAKDGRFIPIYFRFIAKDCSEMTFKIDGIKFTKDKYECILFYCLFTNEGIQQEIVLSFFYKECIWKL
jgi:hypothetical protein